MQFGWSLWRMKRNISQKQYLVKLSFTRWDAVLRCIVPWAQRKKRKKWSKVGLWDKFCTLWMEHIWKTSMWRNFVLEICDTYWWLKSKSTIHVHKMGCLQSCMLCFHLSCDACTTTWWILVFEISELFGWSVSRTKCNIFQKPYSVKSSLTWYDLVLRCMQNCSLGYTTHVDYNVKGTSQNPGTWQNFLETCDACWWVKSKSTIHICNMWEVCNPCFASVFRVMPAQQLDGYWLLRYVYSFGEVCHGRNATHLKNCT